MVFHSFYQRSRFVRKKVSLKKVLFSKKNFSERDVFFLKKNFFEPDVFFAQNDFADKKNEIPYLDIPL